MSSSANGLTRDQYFLLNFIMSNYLGPDLYSENPRCSASHRLARIMPPYTLKHLGSSFLSVSQLESLYYYVLRYAESNLIVEVDTFYTYLKGDLAGGFRQFTSFFPLNVHEHKRYSFAHEIVKGIVLIDDPAVSCISKEDLKRFRCLSRLNDVKIDRVLSLSYRRGQDGSWGEEQNLSRNKELTISDQNPYSSAELQESCNGRNLETGGGNAACGTRRTSERFLETYKRRRRNRASPKAATSAKENGNVPIERDKTDQPVIPPDEPISDASIRLIGTATKGILGPTVGVVDIGINKVAYFFRVSLPGLCKDHCEFSCEVESDGKVILQGSMGGGITIKKQSRVFEIKMRQLCPPGPFTLSFTLPGPVDPRLLSLNFRSDGIFEAVIIRHEP
ncbi:PREDICTED: increased DNA methylation 3 [Tarenaya hassleriana]|uniref:increased DNA methylation 3 n=1 Tax=Tarenaya hassleriana TaxID=28532 RepID=UPI00053C8041|nr:PREDICTED: increased DNA methylation 3 [Tarenaya hassleriana]XP_010537226.1 PREDICTED: increased DNA methylation 3 [Tarenaya hassleriana]XP_010537227.1 PREDICTED: increased DNA methylation 3 [Tarenaya hassleriana]XP_010537229.1 PREDICTED: increased DNA methylation 3 [Tarenaya hassleriana]XP_010537230.1 PREDICTED: increased DNA methylation 3 [Tarenaya hassleriana]